jgi:SUKH-3 immunity protein
MVDESLLPSPEAEVVLQGAQWSPQRRVDISEWVETLRREGNEIFPTAEGIMRNYGGLRLEHEGFGGRSRHDFEVNPDYWYDMREHIELVEEAVGSKVCPLGITTGAAMLAVLEDGRVISEFEGDIFQVGKTWRAALDNLILRRGEYIKLAENYEPISPE